MWESSRQIFNSVSARDDDNNWEIEDVQLSADQSMCLGHTAATQPELDPFDGPVITGACCNDATGECMDGVVNSDCAEAFYPSPMTCATACTFACCEGSVCFDKTLDQCASAGGFFIPGFECADDPDCNVCVEDPNRCCDGVDFAPGCGDPSCCMIVCQLDSYCCSHEWDEVCAAEAIGNCAEPLAAAAAPYDIPKNRYLSFQPNNCADVAFRVTLTSSQFHPDAVGMWWWAGQPNR